MKNEIEVIAITTTCPFCGKENTVIVNIEDFFKWQDGALIQDVFPYLSADERELLISGLCPHCFNNLFIEREEDKEREEYAPYFDDCDYEMGYDPYMGCFSDDC